MVAIAVVIGGLGAVTFYTQRDRNPLPDNLKRRVSYKIIYPSKINQIDPASYNYQADQKTLSFSIDLAESTVVFSEQPEPDSLGANGQVYYPALGLHPYAQFQTKLGPVALAKFWQTGNLNPVGQSAVLASNGTLLIAHSDKEFTNAQWKDLFDSLKITK